jgi:adenosylmethionine---8-amino-7-oxononanoate aminotransferase
MNEDLKRIDQGNYWHAFTQMAEYEPLIIERAEGVWLYDVNGRKLLDAAGSMWCNVHGHRHPAINRAITDQLDKVAHVTSLGMSNPTSIRLTAKLIEMAPPGLECVFYASDGACAVEVALKMAFQYWRQIDNPQPQRDLFLAVGNAYHGDSLGAVSVGGVARFHAMFQPLLFDVVRGPCPDSFRLPTGVGVAGLCDYYLQEYELLFEQFGDRLAAVIIEPLVQGAAGMVMQPAGFLAGLAALAKRFGVLLIADEIATGIGRTGKLWACDWEQVSPDFLVTGKGLSGGYLPVAATLTTRAVWDAFLGTYSQSRSFFHGHTFGGNPLGCAAALATLNLLESERVLDHVQQQSLYLRERLDELATHPNVGDIRVCGLMGAVELVESKATNTAFPWQEKVGHQICQRMIEQGVWTRPLGNVIVLMPPLCIQPTELDLLIEVLKRSIGAQFESNLILDA